MTEAARTNERPTYGPGSRQSFYRDVMAVSGHFGQDTYQMADAASRLRAYASSREERATGMTTGSASGGAFVTPEYLVDQFGLYLSPLSSFVGQCTPVEDPGVGMQMNVPAFTAATAFTSTSVETTSITSAVPAAASLLSANLQTIGGSQPISQQLFDRAGPLGFDKAFSKQLNDQLAANIDIYVVAQAIAGGGTGVSNASAFSISGLWGDVQKAGELMLDSAGHNLLPTHFFAAPKQIQWMLSLTDNTGRPLFIPTPSGAWRPDNMQPSGQPAAGATGTNLLGLSVYHDGNIIASGSNAQLLVARPSELLVQVSEPYFQVVIADGQATSLSLTMQAYCYVGVVARHSAAVQVVTGAAYTSTPTFA